MNNLNNPIQLEFFDENWKTIESQSKSDDLILCQKDLVSQKVSDIVKSQNYIFSSWKIESYQIEVKNWKISEVKFKTLDRKFKVHIDYNIKKETKRIYNYTEQNPQDRETFVDSVSISKLNIISIQQKTNTWYWEVKKSINYFEYAWLEYLKVISFLEALINKYH